MAARASPVPIPDPNPNASTPRTFAYIVGDRGPDERESFSEGLHLLHNPWAQTPLPLGSLRDITEHQLRDDGLVLTTFSRLDPFASKTLILHSRGVDTRELQRGLTLASSTHSQWSLRTPGC